MKKSLVLVGLLTISSSIFAAETLDVKYFVGAEIGSSEATVDAKVSGYDIGNESDSGGHRSIKFGAILNDNHRLSVMYSGYSTDSSVDLSSYSVGYDYMFATNTKFTPFVGIGITKVNYELSGLKQISSNYSKDTLKLNDNQVSLNVGSTFDLGNNFELEAGYRLALIANGSDTVYYNDNAVEFEIEDFNQLYFGVNYKF